MATSSTTIALAPAEYFEAERDGHDLPTSTVHANDALTAALLVRAGISVRKANGGNRYLLPGGEPGGVFGVDFLWDRDEALHHALAIIASRRA